MSEERPPAHDPSVPIDAEERQPSGEVSRRSFLRWSALAGAGASVAGAFPRSAKADPIPRPEPAQEIVEATIAQLQAAMERGGLRSQDLVDLYLERIRELDQSGPNVNSVIQINPDAKKIAKARDKERKAGNVRGLGSSSGWSGLGGQTRNPYVLDRNPCGSSSGSAAAVSANFTSVALGTETDGSIVC